MSQTDPCSAIVSRITAYGSSSIPVPALSQLLGVKSTTLNARFRREQIPLRTVGRTNYLPCDQALQLVELHRYASHRPSRSQIVMLPQLLVEPLGLFSPGDPDFHSRTTHVADLSIKSVFHPSPSHPQSRSLSSKKFNPAPTGISIHRSEGPAPNASSKNAVAFSRSGPLNPTASIWISPVVPIMISIVLFICPPP